MSLPVAVSSADVMPMAEDAALRFVKQEPIEDLYIKEEVDVKQETFEPRMKREHDDQGGGLTKASMSCMLIDCFRF